MPLSSAQSPTMLSGNPGFQDNTKSRKPLWLAIFLILFLLAIGGYALHRRSTNQYAQLQSAQSQLQQALERTDSFQGDELESLAERIAAIRSEIDTTLSEELQTQYEELLAQLQSLSQSSDSSIASTTSQLLQQLTNNAGEGIALSGQNNTTITNKGVISLNNQSGNLSLQGTPNQTSVTQNGSTTTIGTAQDIASTSSPTFQNQTLTGNSTIQGSQTVGGNTTTSTITIQSSGTQNGYALCDASNNCGYSGAGSSYVQGGNSFGNPATLGTNDNNPLHLRTNGSNRITIGTDGNASFTGNISTPGSVSASSFSGNGAGLTNVDAATLGGNTAGNSSGQIAISNGTLNTNLNADQLDGQHGSFYQNAGNINTGTLGDAYLSSNVTLQGNTFNGASQLVQLTSGGILPILDGSQLTNVAAANALQLGGQGVAYYLNASNLDTGTLSDTLLSSNVTLQGNTFNGPNQLVRLTAGGLLPVLDGSQLTNIDAGKLNGQLAAYYLNATNIDAGTLADIRLSSNVPLKDATNTFTGTNNFAGVTATGILQNGYSVCDTSNNCSYAASSGAAGYIQNQTASPQTAGFNISGNGTVGGALTVQGNISSLGGGIRSEKFGQGASAGAQDATAFGYNAEAHQGAIAIGSSARAQAYNAVAIGGGSVNTGVEAISIGIQAGASGQRAIAIGRTANASHQNSIVIGGNATSTANSQLVFGSGASQLSEGFFGRGVTNNNAGGNTFTFNATGGSGENIQGSNIAIAGGRGTGSAAGGNILFQTSAPGASGTALRNLTTRAQIHGGSGNMSIGTTSDLGQLAVVNTNATQVGLVVQGAASQSASLQEWRNSAGAVLSKISQNGVVLADAGISTSAGPLILTSATGSINTQGAGQFVASGSGYLSWNFTNKIMNIGNHVNTWNTIYVGHGGNATSKGNVVIGAASGVANARLHIKGAADHPSEVGLMVQGAAAQTGDLLQARDSGNDILAKIDASGNLTVKSVNVEGAYITFSNNIRGYNVAVASSASSQNVTFGTAHPDANYAVFCTPNWDTTCFVTDKTTTGFTLNYGTAAPSGQLVDWFVMR